MSAHKKPTAIYLDQWVWIQLARTRLGRKSTISTETRKRLVAARRASDSTFPLSEVHYIETWKQRDVRRRSELAVEMGVLSGFETIAPIRAVWPHELDQALQERFGRPQSQTHPVPFGRGAAFALDHGQDAKIDALDSQQRFLFEWEVLRSPDAQRFRIEKKNRMHRDASLADTASEMSKTLKEWRVPPHEKAQRFRIQTLAALDHKFFGRLIAADVGPEELKSLGADGLEDLVRDVPTLWALTELRRLRHRNPAQRFLPTDLNDLRALAVAVVYCDVAIADKAWVHIVNQTDLQTRYGTVVSNSPEEAAS